MILFGIALQPSDEKIVITGSSDISFQPDLAVVRLNPEGAVDSQFNETGITTLNMGQGYDLCNEVLLQPDGKILLTGDIAYEVGRNAAVMRLMADGTRDSSFNVNGLVTMIDS